MSPYRFRGLLFAASFVVAICSASSYAAERGVVFRSSAASAPSTREAVSIAEPAGGQFTYSNDSQKVVVGPRFAIGSAPRTDYAVYSAEEQVGLEALRERLMARSAASSPEVTAPAKPAQHLAVRRVARKTVCAATDKPDAAMTSAAWPKVVRDEHKVCVPKLEYADQSDWRDHLWCFDKGDGNVR